MHSVETARWILCPLRLVSLFPPVLWQSYNRIPLAFKVRFPGDSQSLCGISRVQNLYNGGKISFVLLSFSLWVTHTVGMRFDFIKIMSLLQSCWSYFFVVGHGICLFDGFQHPPVNGCSTASCNLSALTGGDQHMSFYSAILNWKLK